jgi:hypothetical protein
MKASKNAKAKQIEIAAAMNASSTNHGKNTTMDAESQRLEQARDPQRTQPGI